MPALSEYANVYDTALVALEDKEFQVWFDPGPSLYCAEKDGWDFAAENPVSLLGLVAIWEQVGPSAYEEYWWRAGPPSGEPRYRTLPSAPPTGYTPIRERGGQRLFQASRCLPSRGTRHGTAKSGAGKSRQTAPSRNPPDGNTTSRTARPSA